MDEFGVRPRYPTRGGGVDLIWKDADGNRDGDVLRGEKGKLVFPIQTSRRDRRVRQPVEGDVVENVISRKALGLAGKDARHERLTGFVVVEYPGRQADGRVRNPVKRLWAVPHLEGVAKAVLIEKGEETTRTLWVFISSMTRSAISLSSTQTKCSTRYSAHHMLFRPSASPQCISTKFQVSLTKIGVLRACAGSS